MKILASKNFQVIRIKKGHSQTTLAKLLKTTRQHMSQIELGKNGISPQKAKILCEILESDFDELFEIKERA